MGRATKAVKISRQSAAGKVQKARKVSRALSGKTMKPSRGPGGS